MGVFDKLQFWKKDDFRIDNTPETPLPNTDPMQGAQDPFGSQPQFADSFPQTTTGQYPQQASFPGSLRTEQLQQPVPQQYPQEAVHPRDVELILAKLDAIKSEMDALHQRVRKIESTMDGQQLQISQRKYW